MSRKSENVTAHDTQMTSVDWTFRNLNLEAIMFNVYHEISFWFYTQEQLIQCQETKDLVNSHKRNHPSNELVFTVQGWVWWLREGYQVCTQYILTPGDKWIEKLAIDWKQLRCNFCDKCIVGCHRLYALWWWHSIFFTWIVHLDHDSIQMIFMASGWFLFYSDWISL